MRLYLWYNLGKSVTGKQAVSSRLFLAGSGARIEAGSPELRCI